MAKAEARRLGDVPLWVGLSRLLGGDDKKAHRMLVEAGKGAEALKTTAEEALAMLIAAQE
jgi:hypothetical protein